MDSKQAPRRDADVAGDDRLLAFVLDRTQRRFGSLLVASAFALLGPVVLAAWWIAGTRNGSFAGVPGFFSGWAPSVGEGLVLTALVAVIRSAYTDLGALRVSHGLPSQERPTFRGVLWAVGPLACALAIVGLSHTWRLMDTAIASDWLLPRTRVLSAPGWWHGFFIVGVLYWLLAFTARAATVLRRIRTWGFTGRSWEHFESLREKIGAAAAMIMVFAALLYADTYSYAMSSTGVSHGWTTTGLLLCAAAVAVAPSLWFRRQIRRGNSTVPAQVVKRAVTADAVPWIVLLCAPAVVLLAWIAEHLAAWPLLAGAATALGIVAIGAAWFDVFRLNGRSMTPAGGVVMTAALLALECGYLGAVLAVMTATVPAERFTSLPALLWAAPTASLLGAGASVALLLWLLAREQEDLPESLMGGPARWRIVRSAAGYWGMLQLVVIPVAFFSAGRIATGGTISTLEDLLLRGIGPAAFVPLMSGYFGVMTLGLGLALSGSWRRLSRLEKDGHESAPRVRLATVFVNLGVAMVAGMIFYAFWIGTLARFISYARI